MGTSDTDDNSYQVNSDYCMDSVNNHVGRHWRGIQSNYYCTGGILPDSGKYGKWCREGVSAVVTAVFGAIGCLAEPFSDFSCFRKLRTKH